MDINPLDAICRQKSTHVNYVYTPTVDKSRQNHSKNSSSLTGIFVVKYSWFKSQIPVCQQQQHYLDISIYF